MPPARIPKTNLDRLVAIMLLLSGAAKELSEVRDTAHKGQLLTSEARAAVEQLRESLAVARDNVADAVNALNEPLEVRRPAASGTVMDGTSPARGTHPVT